MLLRLHMLIFLTIDLFTHICLEIVHLMLLMMVVVKLLLKLQLSGWTMQTTWGREWVCLELCDTRAWNPRRVVLTRWESLRVIDYICWSCAAAVAGVGFGGLKDGLLLFLGWSRRSHVHVVVGVCVIRQNWLALQELVMLVLELEVARTFAIHGVRLIKVEGGR